MQFLISLAGFVRRLQLLELLTQYGVCTCKNSKYCYRMRQESVLESVRSVAYASPLRCWRKSLDPLPTTACAHSLFLLLTTFFLLLFLFWGVRVCSVKKLLSGEKKDQRARGHRNRTERASESERVRASAIEQPRQYSFYAISLARFYAWNYLFKRFNRYTLCQILLTA